MQPHPDVDLLARARAGDRDAYRLLVGVWGDLAMKVAVLVARDRRHAASAVRRAFVESWQELPSLHSERPFRPWLIGQVVDDALEGAAEARGGPIDALDDDGRATLILRLGAGLSPAEVALAMHENLARSVRRARAAMKQAATPEAAIRAQLADAALGAELPATFFAEAIAPALEDAILFESRRLATNAPPAAWQGLTESFDEWAAAEVPGGSGAHVTVARVERGRLIGWGTRARASAIESNWTVTVEPAERGTELTLRLLGVGLPPGARGLLATRTWKKFEPGAQPWLHRRLEELARAIETRARRATL